MHELISVYECMKQEECLMDKFRDTVLGLVKSMLCDYMISWDPDVNPAFGADKFTLWRSALEDNCEDYYIKMVNDILMPTLRKWITSWDVSNYEKLVRVLEGWEKILPKVTLDFVSYSFSLAHLTDSSLFTLSTTRYIPF